MELKKFKFKELANEKPYKERQIKRPKITEVIFKTNKRFYKKKINKKNGTWSVIE